MTGGVGSWRYMAPEVARHQKYTEKVDIFAWAYILYFMSCGRQPLHSYRDPVNILHDYASGQEPRPELADCPARFRAVMAAAWNPTAAQRPKASELYEQMVEVCHDNQSRLCTMM
jgi:serine/threonine protein kinase